MREYELQPTKIDRLSTINTATKSATKPQLEVNPAYFERHIKPEADSKLPSHIIPGQE